MSRSAGVGAGFLAAAVLLAGCAPANWPARDDAPSTARQPVPNVGGAPAAPAKPPSRQGNPPFYEVFGQRYFVLPDSEGYREQGMASWYGEPFHGRRTSSGAVYDMHEFTAAHKTLPLPSLVRVTNLDSGRSVVVTVNDRGPFVKDRIIDLSFAAAKELNIVKAGTGRVEVEAIAGRSGAVPEAPTTAPARLLYMQVGAFSDEGNAARLKSQLASNGVNNVVIRYDASVRPALYRVRIGPIEGSAEYDALASRVTSLRIANPRLVTEPHVPPAVR